MIDLAGDGGDGTLELLLEPLGERLFEGLVFSAALFPARVFPGGEPSIWDEDDDFERCVARVLAFEVKDPLPKGTRCRPREKERPDRS
jgi:hypothetical protein